MYFKLFVQYILTYVLLVLSGLHMYLNIFYINVYSVHYSYKSYVNCSLNNQVRSVALNSVEVTLHLNKQCLWVDLLISKIRKAVTY